MSEIRDYVMAEALFDNHEHQHGFSGVESCAEEATYRLLAGYADADLATAAGPGGLADGVQGLSDKEFFALWASVRTTGYGQATELACRTLLHTEYTLGNASQINHGLREFLRERSPRQVHDDLLEAAGIGWAVNDACWDCPTSLEVFTGANHPPGFGQALRYDGILMVSSREEVRKFGQALDADIGGLDELNRALDAYTQKARKAGKLVAMKCGLPYRRDLAFENSCHADAERAFEALMQGRPTELRPLHDYLFHRFVARAADFGLPVQVHTGYLAGNYGSLKQGDPAALIPVLQRYRGVRFDLFHAGWPFSEVTAAIGKEFPNVWLDLCWAWSMSPRHMERTLDEWLATVPHNKVFAFGGDTGLPFALVGYALQAREGIARVLEGKIERGEYDEATARRVARRIMHRNARQFYRMG